MAPDGLVHWLGVHALTSLFFVRGLLSFLPPLRLNHSDVHRSAILLDSYISFIFMPWRLFFPPSIFPCSYQKTQGNIYIKKHWFDWLASSWISISFLLSLTWWSWCWFVYFNHGNVDCLFHLPLLITRRHWRLFPLVLTGHYHGSEGIEVLGSQPDRLLHHGSGRRREIADGPSGSFETYVGDTISIGP